MRTLRTTLAMLALLSAATLAADGPDNGNGTVITRPAVRLRSGPGPLFPVTDVLRRGTLVRTGGSSDDTRWKTVTAALAAGEDGRLVPVKEFGAENPPWIAVQDLAAPPSAAGRKPAVADAKQVRVVAASVAACIRGFDENVIRYLNARQIGQVVLDDLLARPCTVEQYRAFSEARLDGKSFRRVDLPMAVPEDFADAVTMDRLAAMVGARLVQSLGGAVVTQPDLRRYVALIGSLLGDASPRYELTYRFVIIRHETANTFCVPGGIVVLTTGLFDLCRDESELAALLAHEIGHIVLQHAERSPETSAETVGIDTATLWQDLAGETTGETGVDAETEKELDNLAEWFLSATLLRRRRTQEELDADRMALYLLARCRYDTGAIERVIRRLHDRRRPVLWEDQELRNHPTTRERLDALEEQTRRYRRYPGATWAEAYRIPEIEPAAPPAPEEQELPEVPPVPE